MENKEFLAVQDKAIEAVLYALKERGTNLERLSRLSNIKLSDLQMATKAAYEPNDYRRAYFTLVDLQKIANALNMRLNINFEVI